MTGAATNPNLPLGPWKRFGVLGGSFDPVHVGHISIAQQVRERLKLEQVVLLPASTPPHKMDGRELATAADRLALCRLAVRDMRGLSVSDFEIDRGGVSYTVDTARRLRAAHGPEAEIFFVIGSDSLAELAHWRNIAELLALIRFAVAERREMPITEQLWAQVREELGAPAEAQLRAGVVPVERVDVSSTQIRELLRRGEKTRGLLRRDVEDYIRRRGLYGAKRRPEAGPAV